MVEIQKLSDNKTITESRYAIRHEIVHSVIHAFGILFGIISIPILTALAAHEANMRGIIGASIYGFCFLMLFTFSTLYHAFREKTVKRTLEIFDHISIYFLIAGTYTPFLLIYLFNSFGITLLAVLWGLTFLGVFFKIFLTGKYEILSVIVYFLMGWILVVGGKRFFRAIPADVMIFILIGGGLYSVGIIFYLWQKYKWNHAIWHFLVLAAAVCHYVAVLLAV
jgi:hemolysin III